MSTAERVFVAAVRQDLAQYGIKLVFRRGRFVNADGAKCFGFFDEKQICVAKGNARWVEVLAHEYSHFIQWLSGSRLYSLCFGPMGNHANTRRLASRKKI